LAGRSALRAGAGLVRVAVVKSVLPIVASIEPCYTTIALPEDSDGFISSKAVNVILDVADENDVVAFGPGAGQAAGVKKALEALLAVQGLKLIIDADGLNCLCKIIGWGERAKAEIVLTPHPGEMVRLWKSVFREDLPTDRTEQAQRLAEATRAVVVLKGAGTVVSDGEKIYVNKTGNPGMATAGAGDVLTGVIAALIGQGLSSFDAAVLGVYTHGRAGDIAAKKVGQISIIATDIADGISQAFMHHSVD